jgi:hypothetical protein
VNDGFNTANGSVAVNVKPQPIVELGSPDTTVCVYDSIVLDAGNPGASYQWSNGSSGQQIRIGSTGIGFDIKTFSVLVTNQAGCIGEDEITVVFDFGACSGVNDFVEDPFVILFPNPGSGNVILQTDRVYKMSRISILEPSGRILQEVEYTSEDMANQQVKLEMDKLVSGLYYVRFQAYGTRPVTLKYILVR